MSRKQPTGVLCPDCGEHFDNFIEFARHIVDNKATHPGKDRLRKAEKWLAFGREIEITEKGRQRFKRVIEPMIIANMEKAYNEAEARGDTKRMAEIERLVEVVLPDEVKQ